MAITRISASKATPAWGKRELYAPMDAITHRQLDVDIGDPESPILEALWRKVLHWDSNTSLSPNEKDILLGCLNNLDYDATPGTSKVISGIFNKLKSIGESRMPLQIRVHEAKTPTGIIHNKPILKRAIKDMLLQDGREDDARDEIVLRKYMRDLTLVTLAWIVDYLGKNHPDILEKARKLVDTYHYPLFEAISQYFDFGDPILHCYFDDATSKLYFLVWSASV